MLLSVKTTTERRESSPDQSSSPAVWITSWALSDASSVDWRGVARTHPDQVDYRFVNGWVATNDLPCREALRAALPTRRIELPDCPALPNVHVGTDGPRVDFSSFCFTPKLISRWAKARFFAARALQVTCKIQTCGGLHLWQDDTKVLAFEPYDRNVPHWTEVSLDLPQGETELTVYFDDLHERDTSCFFQLGLSDSEDLTQTHPATGSKEDAAFADILGNLRTRKIFHTEGTIEVLTDAPVDRPVDLTLSSEATGAETMNVFAERTAAETQATLTHKGEALPLLAVKDAVPGGVLLPLSTTSDGVRYARTIGTSVLPATDALDQPTLDDRKAAALKLICKAGKPSPSRALALARMGQMAEAEALLAPALTAVEEHHDCADFLLLPLLRLWRDHEADLSADLRARLRKAILGFRYWLDEPGNDVMWFWSENHAMCFHACQHLAGQLFPYETFALSGRTGTEQATLGAARLQKWFASIMEHGLAEWNSAAYYPIDLVGLLTLIDMSKVAAVRAHAKTICDQIFNIVALHTCAGVPGGSQGRCYEKDIFAGPATELGTVTAIAFGGPFYSHHERAAALLAISDYSPPSGVVDLIKPRRGKALSARYVQGLDANARLSVWKSAQAQLSTVSDHKTGQEGHQQHVVDLQLAANPLARIWVNHPGDLKPWGGSRPSLWAGSAMLPKVRQDGDQAMLIFDLGAHPIRFTHAFLPADILDDVVQDGSWLFARAGDGFAALWASTPPECATSGLYAGSEWRVPGPQSAWVVIAGDAGLSGDFAAFRAACMARAPQFDAKTLGLTSGGITMGFDDPPDPDFPLLLTPQIDWTSHVTPNT